MIKLNVVEEGGGPMGGIASTGKVRTPHGILTLPISLQSVPFFAKILSCCFIFIF